MRALANRRFRLLLLTLAGIPILVQYLQQTLIDPLLNAGYRPGDFDVYLRAAETLSRGGDPYVAFFAAAVPDPTLNQAYIYPPLLAWLLQPLLALPHHLAVALGVLIGQGCLVAFLAATWRALGTVGLERKALMVTLVIAFYPVRLNLDGAQVNLWLLALSGVWLLAWVRGDRWWGGAALGLGIAVKFLQLPSLLLLGWGRRWRALAAALIVVTVLWAVASPQFLGEYWLKVFPQLGAGTGFRENLTPTGTLYRILSPASFYGPAPVAAMPVRLGALALAVAAGLLTIAELRRRRGSGGQRGLEAAAVVAVSPLIATLAWPSHLVLLLLPILVLVSEGLDRRNQRLLGLVFTGWLLLGPVHTTLLTAIAAGVANDLLLHVWDEASVAGVALLWLASLYALRGGAGREASATSPALRPLPEPVPGSAHR
jgi:hypothetical protein